MKSGIRGENGGSDMTDKPLFKKVTQVGLSLHTIAEIAALDEQEALPPPDATYP